MRYVSFIHWEDASYGVSFPDFPGCVAVGETLDAAVRQGCEALAFHVEGLIEDREPIPPPRTIEATTTNPDLVDWRDGADIVLITLLRDPGTW